MLNDSAKTRGEVSWSDPDRKLNLVRIRDANLIPDFVWKSIPKIPGASFDITTLKLYLYAALPYEHTVAFWLLYKDKEPVGHILVESPDFLTRTSHVVCAYCDVLSGAAGHAILAVVTDWAKRNGAKRLGLTTRRSPRAWRRRYGFKCHGMFMVREV